MMLSMLICAIVNPQPPLPKEPERRPHEDKNAKTDRTDCKGIA
jgi:hypothetical protein